MPTLTKKLSDFSVKSEIGQNWISSTGTVTKSFSLADIPKGSTINSATLTGKVQSQMFGGTYKAANESTVTLYTHSTDSNSEKDIGSKNVKAWLTALNGTYGTLSVEFSYKLNPDFVPGRYEDSSTIGYYVPAYSQEYGYFRGITLTVNYTLPYSAVTAPTSVSLSVANTYPGQKTTLSWSGAKAGNNNAITGYEVWRSTTSKTSGFSKLASTGKSTTSYSITSPSTNVTWYYKVKTLGTVSGYDDSGLSSAVATLSMTSKAAVAPATVAVSKTAPEPDVSVTISWSGAKAGTNNPIDGYEVYRATSKSGTYSKVYTVSSSSTSGSYTDTAPQSGSRYYKVVTVGTYINSGFSAIVSFTVTRTNTSDFTVPDTTEVGTAIPIAIEDNTSRPHVLRWAITNGPSGSANIDAGTETYSLAMPLSNLNSMTTAASFVITYELETQATGGSKIGMVRKTGTITVPEDVKPTVTGATVAPVSSSSAHPVPSAWGLYIAGHSMAHVALSSGVQTAYGASITTYKITGNGASASDSSLPISADSNELQAGTYTFTVTATDTRGRSGSQKLTVTVESYAVPTLQNILSLRTDSTGAEEDEGTYILAQAGATFASCGGNNNVTVAVSYKKESESAYTAAGSLADGQLLFGAGNITLRDNYNVRYIVTDALGESRTYNDIVTRSVWEMHVKRGGGAWAFGGVADTDGALHVYGGIKADDAITSTRNGIGFFSRAASGAVGFSATNTTSGQGVSVQVGSGGTNRGLYDLTGDKWMAYCDGNDALRFAGVTSATKGDLGIDELEDSIGSMKTFAKTLSANSPTTFTFSGFCGVAILIEGANTSLMCILLVHCSGAGNITVSKIGTANNITTSTDTNKLTINNGASSTAAYARVIRITASGTMPT